MKAEFLSLQNTTAGKSSEIPVLEINSWRRWILKTCQQEQGRVVALFAVLKGPHLISLFGIVGMDTRGELRVAATELPGEKPNYPSLTPELPEVQGFERELYEQFNIRPEGHPWLKPIRSQSNYTFYRVEGESVHEVAVGPVHAGIIEPGHFRFQCRGEKVFHLEIQLGYQHRGIEALMVKAKPSHRAVLAESIAGDTVIGHALAYAQALEGLAETSVPLRSQSLRAIALELERVSNHVGDLGALANDVGFLPASAYFGRMRGEFLNLLMELTGNRYGRSLVRPGGVLFDLSSEQIKNFKERITVAMREFTEVVELFFTASTVLARLEHTGVVHSETAKQLGIVGPAARASNLLRDVRHDYPTGAYRLQQIPAVRLSTGDVYARSRVRSLECKRSLKFLLEQLETLPRDKIFLACEQLKPNSLVVSLVEGWRGEIAHILLTDEEGQINRYKVIDPSFHNWMGLAMALRDGQISDFPLCNKSFNLSYAGHDL